MRIAMISRYLPSDSKMGVGYQVHALANAMVARGHTVTVFSQSPKPDGACYALEQVPVRPPLRALRASWYLRSIDWSRFDVLHAHGDDWFLWNKNVPPHVRTIHGSCLAEAAN
ncbi:MAG: glycosyltransferase, partial [Phycisphaerae bacterium]